MAYNTKHIQHFSNDLQSQRTYTVSYFSNGFNLITKLKNVQVFKKFRVIL